MISVATFGQVKFGVKTGANFSFLSERTMQTETVTVTSKKNSDMIVGFLIGAYANYSFNDLFGMQAEALFSMQGGKWEVGKVIQNYINVPLLVDIKPITNNSFSILAGPQFGIGIGRKNPGSNGFAVPYERFDFAAVFGAQYTFVEHLSVGLRYNFGLTPSIDAKLSNNDKIKGERNNVLQLSIGWTF